MIVAEEPDAIVPSEQVKFVTAVQLPCDGVTVPCVNPAGQVSDTDTDVASEGPALETVIVYVPVEDPAVTEATPSVLAIDTSAAAVTVSVSDAVLLPGVVSVGLVTVAVFVCGPVVDAGTE